MFLDGQKRERRHKENGEAEKSKDKQRDKERSHRTKDEVCNLE